MKHARRTRSRRSRQRGIALILALLVLAILVVVVVQFSYSVQVENRIVRNGKDDQALTVAAHGAIPYIAALFRDDNKNQKTPANVDSLADCWNDPNLPDLRKVTLGDTTLDLTIEDLDRRLPLPWLAIDARQEFLTTALKRLLDKLGVDGDHDKISKGIRDKVREVAGVAAIADQNGNGTPQPQPSPSPSPGPNGEAPPAKREIFYLEQLLDVQVENVDMKKVLWGDITSQPRKLGISPFVTCFCTDSIDLNTAPAEVLFAILPQNNADNPPKSLWDDANSKQVVDAIQKRRIDPLYQQSGDGSGSGTPQPVPSPAAGGNGQQQGSGASKSWSGKPFEKVTELSEVQLLASMFGQTQQTPGGNPGQIPQPAASPSPAAGTGAQQNNKFGFKTALAVASKYYAIVVKASSSSGATKTVRMVVARNTQDEVAPLLVREDPR